MRTLDNFTLLYDNDCPMCNLYSCGLQKANMLDANGRKAFGDFEFEKNQFVDQNRAANEIALFNIQTKEVIYGIDALLRVIGNSFPWIEKVGQISWVNFLLKKVYKFISFNRKVIAPAVKSSCTPSFNVKHRVLYILLGLLFTAFMLFQFTNKAWFTPPTTFIQEIAIAFGQLSFQLLFLFKKDYKTILTYYGNITTVSVMGSIFLSILLGINQIINIEDYFLPLFFLIVSIMFLEHFRRVKIMKFSLMLCLGWVLYRILILILLFNY